MREFLATPEVRPEGATVSRRRLLADGGAAVAVTVLATPSLSPTAAHPDAELLAAFRAWVAVQREMERVDATMSDDDSAALCETADDAARRSLSFQPTTAIGWAAQVHLVAHLAYCSRAGDFTDVAYPDDGEETQIMRPVFDRAAMMTARLRAGGVA